MAAGDGGIKTPISRPRSFPFYNPDAHRRLNNALEEKKPAAVVAAAQSDYGQHRDDGSSPIIAPGPPLFADGDMRIPSVTVPHNEGEKLRKRIGKGMSEELKLDIESRTEPSRAENILARINAQAPSKITVVAHFGTWFDTPGAMDNAVVAAVLLGLAESIGNSVSTEKGSAVSFATGPDVEVELFANNGEDYYSSAGSLVYLERSVEPSRTALEVNIDGIGFRGRDTGLSLYECPRRTEEVVREAQSIYPRIVDMDPCPEGDHSIFLMQEIPAIALTTYNVHDLMYSYHHTPEDRMENIDAVRVVEAVEFIASYQNCYSFARLSALTVDAAELNHSLIRAEESSQ